MNNDEGSIEKSENSKRELATRTVRLDGRVFVIQILFASNGCFTSVTEGESPRIGAITLTIKSKIGKPTSSALIPEIKGGVFSETIGGLLAEKFNGIAVTSLFLREEIDAKAMKTLINEVRAILQGRLQKD